MSLPRSSFYANPERADDDPVVAEIPHMLRHSCGFYLTEQGQQQRVIQKYRRLRSLRRSQGPRLEWQCSAFQSG